MPEPTAAELIAHIREAAVVRPGDVLVLRLDQDISRAHLAALRDAIEENIPDMKIVFVGGSVIEMTVMRRESDAVPD
jgi:hypothetical protein